MKGESQVNVSLATLQNIISAERKKIHKYLILPTRESALFCGYNISGTLVKFKKLAKLYTREA